MIIVNSSQVFFINLTIKRIDETKTLIQWKIELTRKKHQFSEKSSERENKH
jgi:hypothetical protein